MAFNAFPIGFRRTKSPSVVVYGSKEWREKIHSKNSTPTFYRCEHGGWIYAPNDCPQCKKRCREIIELNKEVAARLEAVLPRTTRFRRKLTRALTQMFGRLGSMRYLESK